MDADRAWYRAGELSNVNTDGAIHIKVLAEDSSECKWLSITAEEFAAIKRILTEEVEED